MGAELDKIDLQILKILQDNGRITNLQLSNEIGLLKVYVKDIKSYEQLIMEKISRITVVKTFQTMMIMSTNKKEPIVPLEY
jgi:DNA-binding Lrp family transcriptional regulator